MVTALLAPLAATLVAGAFATALGRQWVAKRRDHALAWALSLYAFAGGALAIALGIGLGWNRATFGTYWLLGALLTVPLLAVGQLHLMVPKLAAVWWTVAGLFAAWAVFSLLSSPVDDAVLAAVNEAGGIPRGADVFGEGALTMALLPVANWTALVVVAGSIWSGFRTRRWGVLLIAVGVIVAAASFAFVRAGQGELVSVSLAVGVSLMYGGFVAAGKPTRRATFTTRVTLYTRAGCHLCEKAEAQVARLAPHAEIIDVDSDPALVDRYGVRVPVVEVNGVEVAELEIDPAVVRAAMAQRAAT